MDPVSVFKANKEFPLFAAYLTLVKVLLSATVSTSSRHSALQTHGRLEKLYFSCNKADYWSDASSGYRVQKSKGPKQVHRKQTASLTTGAVGRIQKFTNP